MNDEDKLCSTIIQNMENIPALPAITGKILDIIDRENIAADDLANVISKDQSLTAKVLKLVNSPFYSLSGSITSVSHGVVILGFHTIKNLALGISTLKSFQNVPAAGGLDSKQFWEHSLACAVCAKSIAKTAGYDVTEEVFVAGLLHDLGKLVLSSHFKQDYQKVVEYAREKKVDLGEAEKELLGVSHNVFGAFLTKKWHFPLSLTNTILHHPAPPFSDNNFSDEHLRLASIVYVSNSICKAKGFKTWSWEMCDQNDDRAYQKINIKPAKLLTVSKNLTREINIIKDSFGLES